MTEVFRRLRPGDLATIDNARQMIERMFFDFKRFDIGKVGRYHMNRSLAGIKEILGMPTELDDSQANRTLQLDDLVAIIAKTTLRNQPTISTLSITVVFVWLVNWSLVNSALA